ncbi:MAG: GyrI-like domain-containing protein [Pseudomonadales bacterium]|nr:GyrI-like domain-containing protein [Pseudomonadales bacterium]
MLRQPNFISDDFYNEMLDIVKNKKPSPMLDQLKFETINEGKCIQMLHVGKFENEVNTFNIMQEFAKEQGLTRLSKNHREIYLSDFRKVEEEKLKTVLRFKCK